MTVTDLPMTETKAALAQGVLQIGSAIYHPVARQLVINGETQLLEPRLGDLLIRLAGAGGPVSRETLLDDVWGDEGSDEALTQAISKLRRALGDTARPYRVIETAPKYGYRLRQHRIALAPDEMRQSAGEGPRYSLLSAMLNHVNQHRSFLTGAVVGAGSVIVLAAIWLVISGPGEIEQEIVCPEQASGAECLEIVNAVLRQGK